MNASALVSYVVTFFGGIGVVLLILFLNPEKVEKWSVMLWKVIYYLVKKGEKKIIAHDIQGRVNDFSRSLKNEIINYEPVGIGIQWVTEGETSSEFFRENRLIIRMRHHTDQDKNFVHASMAFIANALLRKTKRYLSPSQKESIDLFVGRKLMEREKPQVIDRFFEDYFSKRALSSDKIMEFLERYEIIDKVGLFFPVLVQELSFLGEKVFYKPPSSRIIQEVNDFVRFLHNYSDREVGDEDTPTDFAGTYLRCGIVIIARRVKLEIGNVEPFIKYVNSLLEKKLENIYLLGSALRGNTAFINRVSTLSCQRHPLEKYMAKTFKAKIKVKGERRPVDNYMVVLRSKEILRYYDKEYQDRFLEPEQRRAEPGSR